MQNLATGMPKSEAAAAKPEEVQPVSLTSTMSVAPIAGTLRFVAQDDKSDDDEDDDEDKKNKKKKDNGDSDTDKKDAQALAALKTLLAADSDDGAGDAADSINPVARAVRERERNRIAAIVESEAGRANAKAALHLALKTAMPRDQAVGMLAALGPQASETRGGDSLRAKMAEIPQVVIGASDPKGSQGEPDNPWIATPQRVAAAARKARGDGITA